MMQPTLIPKDQLWFWTDEWQAMERQAEEDIAYGRTQTFNSIEELLQDLTS